MSYPRALIDELNQLSKETFRTKSKWRKLVEIGEVVPVTEDTKRLTIGEDGKENVEIVKTQVMHTGKNGGEVPTFALKRYTVDEVRAKMLELKEQHAKILEAIRKGQEQKKKQEEAIALAARASGSASL